MKRYRSQRSGAAILEIAIVATVLVTIAFSVSEFLNGRDFLAAIFLGVGVFVFVARLRGSTWSQSLYKGSPRLGQEFTMHFTTDGVHAFSALTDIVTRWGMFTKWVYFDDGFLLFQGPKLTQWIPLSSLEDERMAADLERLLRSQIAYSVDRRRQR